MYVHVHKIRTLIIARSQSSKFNLSGLDGVLPTLLESVVSSYLRLAEMLLSSYLAGDIVLKRVFHKLQM